MSSLWKFYGRHHDLVDRYKISVLQMTICHNHFPVLSSFMTYHRVCDHISTTGVTSGATIAYPSEHLNLPPDFSEVRGTRTLVLYVCFVDRCSTFWTFSFGHCLLFFDIRILISPLVSSNSSSVIVYNSLFRKSRRGICSVARWRSMPIASSTCNAICTQKRYR
jgi:hypothetical protein